MLGRDTAQASGDGGRLECAPVCRAPATPPPTTTTLNPPARPLSLSLGLAAALCRPFFGVTARRGALPFDPDCLSRGGPGRAEPTQHVAHGGQWRLRTPRGPDVYLDGSYVLRCTAPSKTLSLVSPARRSPRVLASIRLGSQTVVASRRHSRGNRAR